MSLNKIEVLHKLKKLEIELGRRPTKRDNSHLYYLSRQYFGSWNNMMIKAGYKCKSFQNPIIPNKLSNSLFYLLGLISTDGHIQCLKDKASYRTMIYTSENEEVKVILELIYSLFKYNASVRSRKTGFSKRVNYEVYVSSKKIASFLNELGIPFGAKSYKIKVSKFILENKDKYFWDYFRGIFDGDGSIVFSGNNYVLKISSGSKNFLEGLESVLISKGFFSFRLSKQDENVWILRTNTKEDINKIYQLFYNNALFFYPRKKNKWANHHV